MSQYNEYLICLRRGHESTGMVISQGDRTTYTCKHCGCSWYTTTKEHEFNIPVDPGAEAEQTRQHEQAQRMDDG